MLLLKLFLLQVQLERSQAETIELQSNLTELRRETEVAKQEARHSRRMLRIALTQAQTAIAAPAVAYVPAPAPPPVAIAPPAPVLAPAPAPVLQVNKTPSPVAPVQPTSSPRDQSNNTPTDLESSERLKRLEEGIRELLQWKHVAAK